MKLAFIGYGEVGQLFARQFVEAGASVAVQDVKFADAGSCASLVRTAGEDRVRLAPSPRDAVEGAEIVVSAVTADQALAAAREAATHLRPGQIYVDLNSVSPSTKRAVAGALGAGVDFVEFAVMSPVAGLGIASPILAGGARAEAVAARLNPLGMKIDAISPDIGVASATKLCRSIVIKGMEAIMVDLSLAGAGTGVTEGVLKSLTASYPGMDWAQVLKTMPGRVARHGVRRAAEMREAARMLEEIGVSGAFAEAIAARHEAYAAETRKG
jgi:3-hydroxyisobutyrate dehydrogenase-like beta-hydroxyacid dehydrogenase